MVRLLLLVVLCVGIMHAQMKKELRGVWVTNVASTVLSTDKNIADAMKLLAAKGFNIVFPVVWNKGYTIYPSQIMTNLFGVSIDPAYGSRDPLQRVIIEAHRNGMEVMPWFEYGFSSGYWGGGTPVDSGFILQKFPSWAAADSGGALLIKNGFIWMSGINPDVQNFMISLMTEVAGKYDVDGIQGDDRLPAMPIEGSYDAVTKSLYRAENGGANPPSNFQHLTWKKWRATKLNNFLGRLRDSVKSYGNNLIVSVAPNPYPWGYDNYLQDAKTWVDSGLIENFIPQLYRQTLSDYTNTLNSSLVYVPAAKKSIMFSGVLARAGSYTVAPDLLVNMVKANRNAGINGESYFFYEAFPANNGKLADTLRKSVYKENALLPYRNGNIYRPRPNTILETDPVYVTKSAGWTQNFISAFDSVAYTASPGTYTSIAYADSFAFGAWFDVYTYMVPLISFTKNARYTLYGDNDSTVMVLSQQDSKNSGWVKLGSVYHSPGKRKFLRIDNSLVEQGKLLLADASFAMINRKKSPDVIITGVDADKKSVPTGNKSFLLQAYPNPFNNTAKISYVLTEAQEVTLSVYDVLGRQVAVLAEGMQPTGKHTASFTGDNLSSGTYIYRLTAGKWVSSGKLMLLK